MGKGGFGNAIVSERLSMCVGLGISCAFLAFPPLLPFAQGGQKEEKGGERGDLPIPPPTSLSRERELCRAKEAIGLPDSPKEKGGRETERGRGGGRVTTLLPRAGRGFADFEAQFYCSGGQTLHLGKKAFA